MSKTWHFYACSIIGKKSVINAVHSTRWESEYDPTPFQEKTTQPEPWKVYIYFAPTWSGWCMVWQCWPAHWSYVSRGYLGAGISVALFLPGSSQLLSTGHTPVKLPKDCWVWSPHAETWSSEWGSNNLFIHYPVKLHSDSVTAEISWLVSCP